MSTAIWKDLELLNEQHWISSDFQGRGEFEFRGIMRFSGTWIGSIRSSDPEAQLFILDGARIEGSINVAHVIVAGTLSDVVLNAKSFEAVRTAKVMGRIRANSLKIEEGAILEGELTSVSAPVL
ncbi:MAG: polymer-forming cytoskeletal protein [Bdellovibrionota bacterium]